MSPVSLDSFNDWDSLEQDIIQIVESAQDPAEAKEVLESRYDPPLAHFDIEEVEDDPDQFRILVQPTLHPGAYLLTIRRKPPST